MNWKEVTVRGTREQLEAIEALLWETGAVAVTVVDSGDAPLFEPGPGEMPLWEKIDVCGLYEEDMDIESILQGIRRSGFGDLQCSDLADRDWEREWLSGFQPMCFGHRLWVCPKGTVPEDGGAPQAKPVVMELDPGLAFGTGTHATTRLCLQWLDAADLAGRSVIDYGCGSGILGIAGLLLGARSVLAVDNDPQALHATRENAENNGVSGQLETCMPDEVVDHVAEVLIANILAQPLIDLADRFMQLLEPGGDLLLSGILHSQQSWVESAYADKVEFTARYEDNGWVCLQGKR